MGLSPSSKKVMWLAGEASVHWTGRGTRVSSLPNPPPLLKLHLDPWRGQSGS